MTAFISESVHPVQAARLSDHAPCKRMGGAQRSVFPDYLTPHQHQLLLDLEGTVRTDGIFLYAAPSFSTYDGMWLNQGARKLIDTSMLVKPSAVGLGHQRWTWSAGSRRGVTHSDPVEGRVTRLRMCATVLSRSPERKSANLPVRI